MHNYQKSFFLIAIASAAIGITTMAALRVQEQTGGGDRFKDKQQRKLEFESQFPIAEYDAPEPTNSMERSRRRAAGKKHDKADLPIDEQADTIFSTEHWAEGLPALPIIQSQAIVIGEITNAQAHLSNDKTNVYSEFTIRVIEVLKSDGSNTLLPNAVIVGERAGGRVRFSSGHITLRFINGQNMPRVGRRYVLFLKRESQEDSFHIVTGYELRAGRVHPLDSPDAGTHPMAKYAGTDLASFLSELRASVNDSAESTPDR